MFTDIEERRARFANAITREEFNAFRAYWNDDLLYEVMTANTIQSRRVQVTRKLLLRQARRLAQRVRKRAERRAALTAEV